MKSLVIV